MKWEQVKKYLQERNRIEECINKNTDYETLVLWNGVIICRYEPERYVRALYASGRPTIVQKRVRVSPPKTIYDTGVWKDVDCGVIPAPNKQPKPQLQLF